MNRKHLIRPMMGIAALALSAFVAQLRGSLGDNASPPSAPSLPPAPETAKIMVPHVPPTAPAANEGSRSVLGAHRLYGADLHVETKLAAEGAGKPSAQPATDLTL